VFSGYPRKTPTHISYPVSTLYRMSPSTQIEAHVDVDELVGYLSTAPIRIAVFGEFSAGKTTVLNALIGEEILSVAVDPTTAVPTRIRYGREFNIFVDREDGTTPQLFGDDPPFWTRFVGRRDTLNTLRKQQSAIQEFLRRWTKEGERANEVRRVVIEMPVQWLKTGIELVDTPGVNNEFVRHQGFTEQEAKTADIAVLLMDARQGGGKRTEFEFMNRVQSTVERCIVVPNKMDLVPADEREEFLEYIREEALPRHWEGAVPPAVIGMSALVALSPDDHDESDLLGSFDELKQRLETLAQTERGKLLLARRGNPAQLLFSKAREWEGEGRYDRAHRTYFDLLDILDAAGIDSSPAAKGIQRCESQLTSQVDDLDDLNERYNRAIDRAADHPEEALNQLKAIEKEQNRLSLQDDDVQSAIKNLQGRLRRRDQAREKVDKLRRKVDAHRREGAWIQSADAAIEILDWTEEAEFSDKQNASLRELAETEAHRRAETADGQWKTARRHIRECRESGRFREAQGYIAPLEEAAPYTTFDHDTEAVAATVRAEADREQEYVELVAEIAERSELLRDNKVSVQVAEPLLSEMQRAFSLHVSLYGSDGNRIDLSPSDLLSPILTIDQKLRLAGVVGALATGLPEESQARHLYTYLQSRRRYLTSVTRDGDVDMVALLANHPDHPGAGKAIQTLDASSLSIWALPHRVKQVRKVIEDFAGHLPDGEADRRLKAIDRTPLFFQISEGGEQIIPFVVISILVLLISMPFALSGSQSATLISTYSTLTIIFLLSVNTFHLNASGEKLKEKSTLATKGTVAPTTKSIVKQIIAEVKSDDIRPKD
jgi:signal recognition particle receptor subunit beta